MWPAGQALPRNAAALTIPEYGSFRLPVLAAGIVAAPPHVPHRTLHGVPWSLACLAAGILVLFAGLVRYDTVASTQDDVELYYMYFIHVSIMARSLSLILSEVDKCLRCRPAALQ